MSFTEFIAGQGHTPTPDLDQGQGIIETGKLLADLEFLSLHTVTTFHELSLLIGF